MSVVLNKWSEFAHDAGAITQFIEWCSEQGWELRVTETDAPIMLNLDQILYRYADIDPVELDNARRELLADLDKRRSTP